MHIRTKRLLGLGAALTLGAVVVVFTTFASAASGSAQHARWDIIRLTSLTPPLVVNAGGFAEAKAPDNTKIRITGAGTFVAPAGHGGGSNAVTGGGNWWTFAADGTTVTGSGTYKVEELVSFVFANLQSPGLIDNIGDTNERANGTAVLRIEFSDGKSGVLTVGCHGPGAPDGIFEGIATTKGFTTYYNVQAPGSALDFNRTIFHVRS